MKIEIHMARIYSSNDYFGKKKFLLCGKLFVGFGKVEHFSRLVDRLKKWDCSIVFYDGVHERDLTNESVIKELVLKFETGLIDYKTFARLFHKENI